MRKILMYGVVLIIGIFLGRLSVRDTPEQNTGTTSISQPDSTTPAVLQESQGGSRTMWVQSNVVNVRGEPDLESVIATRLYRGDTVQVEETVDDWSLVRIEDDSTGWIFSPLLSEERVPPLPAIQVAGTDFSVTEKNNLWWRYSYQVRMIINKPTEDQVKMSIRFVNDNGFELDDDITYIPRFDEAQEYIFRDTKLIDVPVAEEVDSLVVQLE